MNVYYIGGKVNDDNVKLLREFDAVILAHSGAEAQDVYFNRHKQHNITITSIQRLDESFESAKPFILMEQLF